MDKDHISPLTPTSLAHNCQHFSITRCSSCGTTRDNSKHLTSLQHIIPGQVTIAFRSREGREGKRREGKGREGKGREGKGKEGDGKAMHWHDESEITMLSAVYTCEMKDTGKTSFRTHETIMKPHFVMDYTQNMLLDDEADVMVTFVLYEGNNLLSAQITSSSH